MSTTVGCCLVASTAIDAAVLGLINFAGRDARLTAARVLFAVLVTALVAAPKALALVPFAGSFFFAICLACVDTVIR